MDCGHAEWHKDWKVEGNTIFVNGEPYADLLSIDEETGLFEAVLISENQYINGQKVCGLFATKHTPGPAK